MKKGDWLLLGACLLLGAAGLLLSRLQAPIATPDGAPLYARIQVNEQQQALLPLSREAVYLIASEDDGENRLRVTTDGIRMESANCHNQLCVRQGEVTLANAERRPLGTLIVCAPHRVVCELLTAAQAAELENTTNSAAVQEVTP